MEVKILCPQWGQAHLDLEAFFTKVKEAGYDGVDTWIPENREERERFVRLLSEYDMNLVRHLICGLPWMITHPWPINGR